eukprot:IDg17200t1
MSAIHCDDLYRTDRLLSDFHISPRIDWRGGDVARSTKTGNALALQHHAEFYPTSPKATTSLWLEKPSTSAKNSPCADADPAALSLQLGTTCTASRTCAMTNRKASTLDVSVSILTSTST